MQPYIRRVGGRSSPRSSGTQRDARAKAVPDSAARRWADTCSRAWPQRDAEAIAALYADTAVHRSPAFAQPYSGLAGVRRYLAENLLVEEDIECWFGEPIASGDRAAVEWWGSWREQGEELTFAGVTVLRFDGHGQVVDHRD